MSSKLKQERLKKKLLNIKLSQKRIQILQKQSKFLNYNRKELVKEMDELLTANKKLQEEIALITTELTKKSDKYKELEKMYKEEISNLEAEVKRTKTEEFVRLRDDNKKLIEENICLKKHSENLEGKIKLFNQSFSETSKEVEDLKNLLLTELDNAKLLMITLNNEKKIIDLEKYLFITLELKQQIIRKN